MLDLDCVGKGTVRHEAGTGAVSDLEMDKDALDALFRQAFSVAKEIHTHTGIATGRVSVGSTAVDLARQIFSRFEDKIVLMVGAGKMGEMTLRHLLTTHPKELWVTNRTDPRAADLAARLSQRKARNENQSPGGRRAQQQA